MKKIHTLFTISLYLITITIILAFLVIYYFQKQLGPGLIKCAEDEVNHLASQVMNNCISKYLSLTGEPKLLSIERNDNGEIKRIHYDTKILNNIRTEIIDMLEIDLENLVKGEFDKIGLNINKISDEYYERTKTGIIFTVSTGSITSNPLLSNLGPKIPLNLNVIGDSTSDITTNIKEYGLNNALIEISIVLKSTLVIHMPFLSKEVNIKNTIPLNIELLQGTLPNYYSNYNLE